MPRAEKAAMIKPVAVLGLAALCLGEAFDYVIVGAGTCGLLLANRLSQEPGIRVAVMDPGSAERGNKAVEDPASWMTNFSNSYLQWGYTTVPQAGAAGRVLEVRAGKGIGGSSLINGMTYIRGDKAQLDAWEALGNAGWNWDALLPYYKRVERLIAPEPWQVRAGASVEAAKHGTSGDLHVGFAPALHNGSLYGRACDAWASLGLGANDDVNSGATRGFGVWPQTLYPRLNRCWDAATAFLWPVVGQRANLHLVNGTATRVVWKGGRRRADGAVEAAGVAYETPARQRRVARVRRAVILSAGALRTPLILERSGVGDRRLLRAGGIRPVIDLPGVGENLMDQASAALIFNATARHNGTTPYVTFASARDLFGDRLDEVAMQAERSLGAWARQLAGAQGAAQAAALEHMLRVQHRLVFEQGVTVAELLTVAVGDKLLSALWGTLPLSRGSVHVRAADADGGGGTHAAAPEAPAIDPRFLAVGLDAATHVATGRLAARLWETQGLRELRPGPGPEPQPEPQPGPAAAEAQWRRWAVRTLGSNAHPVGTAAMMARALGGVVDARLAVYGAAHLRVVDALVLPLQLSGHPTATLYAVAERAADMIRRDCP